MAIPMAAERSNHSMGARDWLRGGKEGEVRLADGRRLVFIVHGDEFGYPVVLEHGTPASRLGLGFADARARARGVRVICPDRPGIGRSDPAPRRSLLGWADDVTALADALEIHRFGVIGYSCGGLHALACAARLPARVSAVALMAGAGPLDRPEAFEGLDPMDRWLAETSARRPLLAALALRVQAAVIRRAPGLALRALLREVGDADRRRLAALGPDVMMIFTEALRQGPDGVVDDYRRWITPWPFAFEDIEAPVDVWQGDDDRAIPMHHAERLAARLPRATLHQLPGAGHFSVAEHFDSILDRLLVRIGPSGTRRPPASP